MHLSSTLPLLCSLPTDRMIVRIATPEDASAIEALIAQYVPSGNLLPRSAAFAAAHAHDFVVAEAPGADGKPMLVGCAHLDQYSPTVAELRSLAVSSAHH